jgi:predicted ATPase
MSDIVDFVSTNAPDLPSKEQVKLLCTKQGRTQSDNHFIHVHNGQKLFIKYEVPRCEWNNHQFVFDRIRGRASTAIRIPEIFAVFGESDRLYLIMEFIQTDHIASDIQRARAISDLVSIEAPIDITPGPIGGGRIHMRIFWDYEISDVNYPSI